MTPRALPSLFLSVLAATAFAQEGVPQPPGLVPEQMWYAPTAADWKKPVLMRWQRTWDDAVRLSQATRRPILVCVNMDGEIASEHYAGVRYRDPELAKLFEPYVCVIASVYRHNERDYDEQGNRIPCPRLGGVTCGEHIDLEPIVYAKFLDGKRISPRHIMVELDGSEVYDVFYTWDVDSVYQAIKNGIQNRREQAVPIVKGDRSLQERIESPDSEDREQIERLFQGADLEQKRALLEAAVEAGAHAPVELLRLAAFGLDPELARRARAGMLEAIDPGTVELIADTLRAPMAAAERKALAQSLRRFAGSTRAMSLATAHSGLAGGKATIDTKVWGEVLQSQDYAAAANRAFSAEAAARADAALQQKPDDPTARLDVAEASLLQAFDVQVGSGRGALRLYQQQRELLLSDAVGDVDAAAQKGAADWRIAAIRALVAQQRGQHEQAFQLAIAAAPALPTDAPGRLAVELLSLFAAARQNAIATAVKAKQPWPPEWMSDVHAAYSVLDAHPLGRDEHVANHYDFLDFFRAPDADQVLDRGLERFPASGALHQRLRQRALRRGGEAELAREYVARLAATGAPATVSWFAGFADLVIAEAHRRRSEAEPATAAYQRAMQRFVQYREATGQHDGDHYVAMAHGGLARLRLQADDLAGTLTELELVFRIAPTAAAATDGLGMTAMQTAEMLRGRALTAKDEAMLRRLDAALQQLPPEAFELPEYERNSRPQRRPRRGGGEQGR
ncbi:MAG: hypothetical protein IT455_16675 [Planctomycetes bacterium]|nr:hypothetical protein [Planctomycetota bacterium]